MRSASGTSTSGWLDAQKLRELAGVEHLLDDVAAANQLALDVKLREGGPVVDLDGHIAKRLQRGKHVDGPVLDAECLEHLHDAHREAAARLLGDALHEQQDLVVRDELLNLFFELRIGCHD